MITIGDTVLYDNPAIGNGRVLTARVQDLTLLDNPGIGFGGAPGQRLTRAPWRLVRKGWIIVTVVPLDSPITGTYWARGAQLNPVPLEGEETIESLIRNEMVEE